MAECRYCSNEARGTQALKDGGELNSSPLDFIACSDHIEELTSVWTASMSQSLYEEYDPEKSFYEWNRKKVQEKETSNL
ncbi:hypothetical protein LCGC14_2137170 [marine sediment metagenome]|uniref:Uncharacterized protein n=1 Tax=marine sediment metagenome TaxID=412755 RepID=A0A0F9DZP8_9ZZZZ